LKTSKSVIAMLERSSQQASLVSKILVASSAYGDNEPGAREQLLNLSYALISSLELPSETIQRIGWAEVGAVLVFSL
jgi:hypothetical protein